MSSNQLVDEILSGEAPPDAYDALPAWIRGEYTRNEWLWLSDREKGDLLVNSFEPEAYEDS